MRLLIVSGIFHPDVGGPATYLYELAHAMTREGHQVAVLTYGPPDVPGQYPFPVWRVARSGSAVARLSRFTRELLRVSRGYPLWYVNDYGIPALLAARVRRPRIVMKVVGDFAWEYARRNHLVDEGIDEFQSNRHSRRIELLKRVQRSYVRRAARVIVPSHYLAGIIRGWGVDETRISVVPNAVSWATVPPMNTNGHREPATLLTAARLAPWKGIDRLLQAFAVLRARGIAARLVIAGDGPEGPRLKALAGTLQIEDSVMWLGNVERGRILHWMKTATLFLLLSEYEGLSHVLLEAMVEGLPVVVSGNGGNLELISDRRNGVIVNPRDPHQIAAVLEELLGNPGERERLAAAAREGLRGQTWESLMERTQAVFRAVEAERS